MGTVDNILQGKIDSIRSEMESRFTKAGISSSDFSNLLDAALSRRSSISTEIPMMNVNSKVSTSPGNLTVYPNENTYNSIIARAAKEYSLDPNFVKSVVRLESHFKVRATSSVGAMGLMQLMPGTAASLGVTDGYNAEQNIFGGAQYLRKQLDRFGDTRLALAAYYTGPNRLERILNENNITNLNDPDQYNKLPEYIRSYIERVMKNYSGYTS